MARLIDADTLKRKAQKVAVESWKMQMTAKVETVLNQFIDWIEDAPTVYGWISVKERLPGEDGRYLVYNMSYCNALAFVASFSTCLENVGEYDFDGEKRPGWFSYDDEYGYYEIDGVTHWMPLPEPPKEDDNGE